MANSPREFANRMDRRAERIEQNVNRRVRRIGLAIFTELIVQTPVDTGRARSNWVITLERPSTDPWFEAYVPGKDGSTAQQNSTEAIQAGTASISDRRPEQDIYIVNNLPYIERLAAGWSSQAPPGWVENAVQYGIAAGSGVRVVD